MSLATKNLLSHERVKLLVTFVILALLLLPIGTLNNLKFIVLSFYLLFLLTSKIKSHKRTSLNINYLDISWLGFILIGFLSIGWATDPSLVWNKVFGWSILILFMILFRSLMFHDRVLLLVHKLLILFFIILLVMNYIAIYNGLVIHSTEWNYFFGKNRNYTSSYLVALYPFILFLKEKRQLLWIIKFICGIAVGYVLVYTGSRAASVAFFLLLVYYLWSTFSVKLFVALFSFVATISFIIISKYDPQTWPHLHVIGKFQQSLDVFRLYELKASLWMFMEHPILGVGLGNWHVNAFKYDMSLITDTMHQYGDYFVYFRSHNIYASLIGEVGIIGFLFFVLPIAFVVLNGIARTRGKLNSLEKSFLGALFVYLSTSFFYCSINFHEYHFSSIQFLGFCAMAVLTRNAKIATQINWLIFPFLFLSFLSIFWFTYSKMTCDSFFVYNNRTELTTQESIDEINKIYNPLFKNTHNYKTSFPLILAQLNYRKESIEQAEMYFETAIELDPYSPEIILGYSEFLMDSKKDYKSVKKYLIKFFKRQNSNLHAKLLLGEIAIFEKDFEEAKGYLEQFHDIENRKNVNNELMFEHFWNEHKGRISRIRSKIAYETKMK